MMPTSIADTCVKRVSAAFAQRWKSNACALDSGDGKRRFLLVALLLDTRAIVVLPGVEILASEVAPLPVQVSHNPVKAEQPDKSAPPDPWVVMQSVGAHHQSHASEHVREQLFGDQW